MGFGKQQRQVVEPFNVNKLEADIRATAPMVRQQPRDLDEKVFSENDLPHEQYAPKAPLPNYVEHLADVDNVGRLSAEAIVKQYENAAKQVEEMGNDIKVSAEKLAAALAEHDADMKMIAETAQAIRDRGKAIFLQIETASQITTAVRNTCAELKKKIEQ